MKYCGLFYLQAVMKFVEHHCIVSMVLWEGTYPSLCWQAGVCLSLQALFASLPLVGGAFLVLLGCMLVAQV